mmetsp:Transcript_28336/g.69004  ORF Transcript_28336/g.69004 Transcript_28336/m.69004 type:complete len:391 (-) Transcript_28336:437-1609(-)
MRPGPSESCRPKRPEPCIELSLRCQSHSVSKHPRPLKTAGPVSQPAHAAFSHSGAGLSPGAVVLPVGRRFPCVWQQAFASQPLLGRIHFSGSPSSIQECPSSTAPLQAYRRQSSWHSSPWPVLPGCSRPPSAGTSSPHPSTPPFLALAPTPRAHGRGGSSIAPALCHADASRPRAWIGTAPPSPSGRRIRASPARPGSPRPRGSALAAEGPRSVGAGPAAPSVSAPAKRLSTPLLCRVAAARAVSCARPEAAGGRRHGSGPAPATSAPGQRSSLSAPPRLRYVAFRCPASPALLPACARLPRSLSCEPQTSTSTTPQALASPACSSPAGRRYLRSEAWSSTAPRSVFRPPGSTGPGLPATERFRVHTLPAASGSAVRSPCDLRLPAHGRT